MNENIEKSSVSTIINNKLYVALTRSISDVYFIASSIFVRKAKVVRNAGGFCTIIFDGNGNCGASGTRVRESKLYRAEEEANEVVKQHKEVNKRR